jgi:hypothetical protein
MPTTCTRPSWFAIPALATALAAQGTTIGFEETWALAADRAAAVASLIPATDDWYYWHCRERLDARDFAAVRAALPAWIQRHGRNDRVLEIENREALLAFADDPERTFRFLQERLRLTFDHQRAVPGAASELPTRLDPSALADDPLTVRALQRHPGTVQGFTDRALPRLTATALDANTMRNLLARLDRPDVENLPALVVRDLDHPQSGGFGNHRVHAMLRLAQLEECARLRPSLLQEPRFVEAFLVRLQPGADTAWQEDPTARAAQLQRLWDFAQRLSPAFNSLKGHVLYHWLRHDLTQGAPDKDRFLAYVRLPRRSGHPSEKHLLRHEEAQEFVALDGAFPTGLPPIADDEPVVRACLEHFFADEDDHSAYAEFLDADWLKLVLAETKLLLGRGDMERWYSLVRDPAWLDQLKARVEIRFPDTARVRYGADDDVSLEVDVKNVPKLLLKVYAIDAFRYHVERLREVDASIPLDGVLATFEQTREFTEPPLRRLRTRFDLPMLREPGTWVVELVGNGISSRAVIHKGCLRCAERTTAAGQAFRIHDEAGQRLPDASLWFGGREYAAGPDGEIVVPFSTDPGPKTAVLRHGNRSSLAAFEHRAEVYELRGHTHVDREALIAGEKAKLLVRPRLRLCGHDVSVRLLQQPVLSIVATDLDGRAMPQELRDIELTDARELVHEIAVPPRLRSLTVTLRGKVKDLAGNDVELVSPAVTFAVNGMDETAETAAVMLLPTAQGHVLEVRGKDGEVKAGRPYVVSLGHRDYADPIEVPLQTDAQGRIHLGQLPGITWVAVARGSERVGSWLLPTPACKTPAIVHGRSGETLRIPYQGAATQPAREEFSLLGHQHDEFGRLGIADGFLELRNLPPGDYTLVWRETGAQTTVRITEGSREAEWIVGKERFLQATNTRRLHLRIAAEGEDLVVRVANPTEGTRVHVVATRYQPAFDPFAQLHGDPAALPGVFPVRAAATSYHSGRRLGDEMRYVLERRFATKFPGNMLPRPSLLLNPWRVDEAPTAPPATPDLGDRWGAGPGGPSTGGPAPTGNYGGMLVVDRGAFANLDFLPRGSTSWTNLAPDAQGEVRLALADLGAGHLVHVLAIDGQQAVRDTLVRDEAPLQPRARRLQQPLDSARRLCEQKRIEFVAAGAMAPLSDAHSAQAELFDSLAAVHRMFTAVTQDQDLAKFAFVLRWPQLTPAEKREQYAAHACHELHFFLSRKDPEFFAQVVMPFLANKLDKTFLDHWLLGDDLRAWLEPWAFAQLNLIEQILLARRLDGPARQSLARLVRERRELRPLPQARLDELFDLALVSHATDVADKRILGYRDQAGAPAEKPGEAGPADRMPPRPPEAPGAPGRRARVDEKRKADADDAPGKETAFDSNEWNRAIGIGGGGGEPDKLRAEMERRDSAGWLYRAVERTKVLAEQGWWRRRRAQATPDVVAANQFWLDYATATDGQPFASTAVTQATGSFLEMMMALAVLDLPFEAGKHDVIAADGRRTLRAATPLLLAQQQIVEATAGADLQPLLLGENFFRLDDRYRFVDGERRDAFVTGEFLADVGYGCQIVVTNPTSSRRTADVLLQIPAGSLPLQRGFWTKGVALDLQPYATATIEYAFYFPGAGSFAHYPAHATEAGRLAAAAEPRTMLVVERPSQVDTSSWEVVSQQGTAAEVLAFLAANNVRRLDLAKAAWRLRDREFFTVLVRELRALHCFDATLWSYGILHRDAEAAREYLRHADGFLRQCGTALQSPLVTIDPRERRTFEHLEMDPLVLQRAHRLGSQRTIGNADLARQYRALLDLLGCQPRIDDAGWLAVTYYLLLQDRIEDALGAFAKVDAARIAARVQYDYLSAYLCFFTGEAAKARSIAEGHRDHPVAHWRRRFVEVLTQLDEAEGRARPAEQGAPADPAARAPSLELAIDGGQIGIAWRNLPQCEIRYYELDVEFAFSAQPFASDGRAVAAFVQPAHREVRDLPAGETRLAFDLPQRFADKNVLIEVRGGGLVRSQRHLARAFEARFLESWGQVAVTAPGGNLPLPQAYVKVFARLPDGTVRFHKDGYTDLRGRFDYASLSDDPNAGASRYAVLVLAEQRGAAVREVAPPTR